MRDAHFITKPRFVGAVCHIHFKLSKFYSSLVSICLFFLQDFAINLENKVFSINEALQMKSLTFVIDACKILAQARKVGILNGFHLFWCFQLVSLTLWLYLCNLSCRCWRTRVYTAITTRTLRRWMWWSNRQKLLTFILTPCRSCLVGVRESSLCTLTVSHCVLFLSNEWKDQCNANSTLVMVVFFPFIFLKYLLRFQVNISII